MNYHEALKIYFNRTGQKWHIPKSNSKIHKEVMKMMGSDLSEPTPRGKQKEIQYKYIKGKLKEKSTEDLLKEIKKELEKPNKQTGSGLLNTFVHKTLESRPKILDDLITLKGDVIIKRIEICRNPIKSIFEKLINIASFGMLKRAMDKLGYDRLYHLYLVLYLNDGSVYSLEKNQRVNIINSKISSLDGGMCISIDYGKKNLRDFITTAEDRNIDGFYRYSGFQHNCQKWVFDILNSNGINKFNDFIKQDVDQLVPKYLKKISNFVTDVAGVGDYIYRGGTRHKKTMVIHR